MHLNIFFREGVDRVRFSTRLKYKCAFSNVVVKFCEILTCKKHVSSMKNKNKWT
jgi:hypothetical protein